jgi:hypothetical protein
LEVVKVLDPDDDPGWFNLQIDGVTREDNVSDGATTGPVIVDPGAHTVGETAGSGTVLDDYDTSWACTIDGEAGPSGDGTTADVEVGVDQTVVCTFTNQRKTGSLGVVKQVDDDSLWTLSYSGPASGSAEVGNGEHLVGDPVPTGAYDVSEVPAAGTDGSRRPIRLASMMSSTL